MHDEQCPHAELAISEERLQRLFQGQARWFTLADDTGTAMAMAMAMAVLLGPTEDFSLGRFIDVFRLWREATEEFRTAARHPLAPLMKAWFASRPRPADTSTREKERIIRAQVAMAPPGDRRAGKLFSVAAHVEHGPDGQLVMPGFQLGPPGASAAPGTVRPGPRRTGTPGEKPRSSAGSPAVGCLDPAHQAAGPAWKLSRRPGDPAAPAPSRAIPGGASLGPTNTGRA